MNTYHAIVRIRAECEADARELLNDYTGQQNELKVLACEEEPEEDDSERCEHCGHIAPACGCGWAE